MSVLSRNDDHVNIDKDTIMFMDNTTLYEVINIQNHITGTKKGINGLIGFTEDERVELNFKTCKEIIFSESNFRRKKITVIAQIKIDGHEFEKVNSYKLLGL